MDIVAVKIFLNWTSGCGRIAVKVCIEVDLGAVRCVKCLLYFKKIFYYFWDLVKILQILI